MWKNPYAIATEIKHAIRLYCEGQDGLRIEDRFGKAVKMIGYAMRMEAQCNVQIVLSEEYDCNNTLYSAKYAAAIVEKGEPTDYVLMPTLTWDVDEGKSALLNLAEWFEDIAEGGVS